MRRLLLFPLIAGCGGDDLVFLDRPWAADRTVVLLAVNADGPIGAPSISTGEKLQLSIDADPPFSVFAWVFAAEVLAPGCSVGIGGEGFPLPQGEVWEALVRGDRGPSFARAEAPSIDLKTACALPLPCPDSTIESWPIPQLAGNITAIVPLDGRRALIAGDRGTRILDFDGDQRRYLDTAAIPGWIRTLARDGGTIYGSTREHAFRFDLSDEIIEVETSTTQRGLELVPGGPPIVYGELGIREVFTPSSSSTTAIERATLDVRHVRMVAADNGMLVDEMSMIYSFGGISWTLESPGEGGLTVESFRRVDGDESSFMTVGRRENAFIMKDGVWQQLPFPFGQGISFNDVEALGNDRFFVVGDFGTGLLRQDGIWCSYTLIADLSIHRVSRSEDPNILFAGTDPDADGVPHLLRITLE